MAAGSTVFNIILSLKLYRNVFLNIDRNTSPVNISFFRVDVINHVLLPLYHQRYYLSEFQRESEYECHLLQASY